MLCRPLRPAKTAHCLPSVDAGQSPKPVHRCKVDLEFIRPLSKSPCPQPSNGIFPETGSANSSAAVFDLYRHTFWCSRDHPAPDRPGYQSTKGRSPGPRPSGPSCCGRPRIPRAILQGGSPAGPRGRPCPATPGGKAGAGHHHLVAGGFRPGRKTEPTPPTNRVGILQGPAHDIAPPLRRSRTAHILGNASGIDHTAGEVVAICPA